MISVKVVRVIYTRIVRGRARVCMTEILNKNSVYKYSKYFTLVGRILMLTVYTPHNVTRIVGEGRGNPNV